MKQDLNEIDMFYIEEVKHNHVYKPYSGSYKPKTASYRCLRAILALGVIVGVIALIDNAFYTYIEGIIG